MKFGLIIIKSMLEKFFSFAGAEMAVTWVLIGGCQSNRSSWITGGNRQAPLMLFSPEFISGGSPEPANMRFALLDSHSQRVQH